LNEDQKKETENQDNNDYSMEKVIKSLENSKQILLIINKILTQKPDCPDEMVKATKSILNAISRIYDKNKGLRYLN
jgi:hypothetical protein